MRSVSYCRVVAGAVGLLLSSAVFAQQPAPGDATVAQTPATGGSASQSPVEPPTPALPRGNVAATQSVPISPASPTSSPFGGFQGAPTGFNAGAFTVYPAITGGGFYDDNVFAGSTRRLSDWAEFVRPELTLRSVGQQYAVQVQGAVERRWYDKYTSEDQTNGVVSANTLYMPDPDTQIIARGGYSHGHEDRGSGDSQFFIFDRPQSYDTYEAAGAINKRFGRWYNSLGAANLWLNYQTPTIGGVPVDVTYRDGQIGVVSDRVGYVIAPLTSLFVEGAVNRRDFKVNSYDSTGYRVVGGVLLEDGPGARVKGEAYFGYMNQIYTGPTFANISTATYGGNLAFRLTDNLTAVTEGRREAKESGLNNGVSVIESQLGGRLDYRILPKVVIGGGVTYLVDDFLLANRRDTYLGPLASLRYFINPNTTLGVDYRYITYDPNAVGTIGYYRNVILLALNARL